MSPPCVNVDIRGGVGVQEKSGEALEKSAEPVFFGGGRVSKIPSL